MAIPTYSVNRNLTYDQLYTGDLEEVGRLGVALPEGTKGRITPHVDKVDASRGMTVRFIPFGENPRYWNVNPDWLDLV